MNNLKILLAEDEKELSRALQAVLKHEGYDIDAAYDGEEASNLAKNNVYDAAVLDIMMPKKDGITVLKEMRSNGDITPVLMLTAKAEIENRVDGLDAGADDYLTKPFAMKELLARLRSMTRRREQYSPDKLKFGNTVFDTNTLELSSVNSIRLANKEAELLEYMIHNAGKTLSTECIFDHVWLNDKDADKEIVWVYISFLRKKLDSVNADSTIEGEKDGSFVLKLIE